MISARLDIALVETIQQHAAAYRLRVIDLEEALFALCRVSSAQFGKITDADERAAILCVLVEELQRAAQGQSSEREPGAAARGGCLPFPQHGGQHGGSGCAGQPLPGILEDVAGPG